MANVKFSEFPSAATVGATDIIPILQGGVNKKATALIFSDYIGSAFVGLTGNQTVAGVKTFSSQLISTVAIGTAPFSVVSTTKVTNLNADLLDGLSSAAFQTVLTNPITGTGTTNYLPKFTGASALGNSLVYDSGTAIGIGTTTPALPLHLYNSAAALAYFESTNANGAYVIWRNSGTSIGDVGSALGISGSNSASDFMVASRSGNMILGTSSTERMRITSAGVLLVNQTTLSAAGAGTKMQVATDMLTTGSLAGYFFESRSGGVTASANWYGWYATSGSVYLYNGAANIASINGTTGIYTPLSDFNKKKDFEASTIGLNEVLQLKPTLYRMKTDDESAPKELGFIAQEVKEFIPQAYVESGEDDSKFIGLNDRPIIAALVKAVQEQNQLILDLQLRINNLELK